MLWIVFAIPCFTYFLCFFGLAVMLKLLFARDSLARFVINNPHDSYIFPRILSLFVSFFMTVLIGHKFVKCKDSNGSLGGKDYLFI